MSTDNDEDITLSYRERAKQEEDGYRPSTMIDPWDERLDKWFDPWNSLVDRYEKPKECWRTTNP